MDPFTALGIAANIFQIVQLGGSMLTMVKEFKATGTTTDMDHQMQMAKSQLMYAQQLRDLYEALQRPSPGVESTETGPSKACCLDYRSLALSKLSALCAGEIELISAIESKAQALIDELARILPKKKTLSGKYSSLHSLRAAAQHLWKQSEIETMEKRLEYYRSELAVRLVAAVNEKIHDQSEKITEILSLNRSIDSWIQPHAAIITRSNGKSETLLRPHSWKDFTGKDAMGPARAIYFRPFWTNNGASSEQTTADPSNATFNLTFSSVEIRMLDALRFRNIDARQQGVVDAHGNTFQWIFDESARRPGSKDILDWLESGQGCFWISGKAGAGKSSLMKLIANHRHLRTSLLPWVSRVGGFNHLVIASFFIHRYGEHLQNSQEGLLRALLYQILDQRKDLIPIAFPSLCRTLASSLAATSLTLTLDELRSAFKTLTRSLPDDIQLFLIIDGLDEYTGDYRDLIELFKSASTSKSIKALVSSRPIPSCESAFSSGPHLRLQDLTKPDILEYVRDQLEANDLMVEKEASEPGITREIADNVIDKASGVFLWVSLVVRSLLVGLENYDRKKDLLARIDELPSDLEKLYSFMMSSVSDKYQQEASLMLQLVHRSRQVQIAYPLTVLQLSFAEEAELDGNTDICPDLISGTEILQRCKTTQGRMRSRCCGLIEVKMFQSTSPCCGATTREMRVDYLHRTVVEFLDMSEVWEIIKKTNPLSEIHLDRLLSTALAKEVEHLDLNALPQCENRGLGPRAYLENHVTNARAVHSVVYCINYSRSIGDVESSNYVNQLKEMWRIAQRLPSRLHVALVALVNEILLNEGVYLQGASDCRDGFLLYAAANGLADFVSWMIEQSRPDEGELRTLLLYLLTNIGTESYARHKPLEQRRAQVRRLARGCLAILRQGLNPNHPGLYWPDIHTAGVTKDIEVAVLRSPKQDNGLVPWIYWLTCYDSKNALLMNDKMLYYEILDVMIVAGADLKGILRGEGKDRIPILTLVQKTFGALDEQVRVEQEMLSRIRRHLDERARAGEDVGVQKARRRSRLSSIRKGFARIRVAREVSN